MMKMKLSKNLWSNVIVGLVTITAILFVSFGLYNINNNANNYNRQIKQFYHQPYNVSLALVPAGWDNKLEGYVVDKELNKIKFDKCTMKNDNGKSYAGCETFDGKYIVILNHFRGGKAFDFNGITLTVKESNKTTVINNYKKYESAHHYLLMRKNTTE